MSDNQDEVKNDDVKVFVGDSSGPDEYTCFFEDDGETGYFYVSDRKKEEIVQHLQIYTNSAKLGVDEKDVEVAWSRDGKKCGVWIWGGLRGIIDLANKREGRVFLENRNTPPIDDPEWLNGFEYTSRLSESCCCKGGSLPFRTRRARRKSP